MASSILSPLFSMPLARSVTEPPLQSCNRKTHKETQNNEKELNMSQHIELNLNNMLKSGASEMRRVSRGETAEDENVFDHKISQQEERRWK